MVFIAKKQLSVLVQILAGIRIAGVVLSIVKYTFCVRSGIRNTTVILKL
jgi:sRNA-binding regulator protein Hfq